MQPLVEREGKTNQAVACCRDRRQSHCRHDRFSESLFWHRGGWKATATYNLPSLILARPLLHVITLSLSLYCHYPLQAKCQKKRILKEKKKKWTTSREQRSWGKSSYSNFPLLCKLKQLMRHWLTSFHFYKPLMRLERTSTAMMTKPSNL